MKCTMAVCLLIGFLFMSIPAAGAIYRFVDENGVIHFTNCPKDPRYRLFIGESESEKVSTVSTTSNLEKQAPGRYDQLISKSCQKYQVDEALIKAIIRAESAFNPQAVSKKGAMGLMQLMPETAKRMKVSDAFDPKENIEGGVRYFKYLLSMFNDDLKLSLSAYNAGENLVAELKSVPPYRETIDYVKKVLRFYQSYKD